MKSLSNFVGTIVFWLSWPIIHISVRVQPRTRVLVICKDEILVVMDLIGPGRWSLPGGGLHRNESPRNGAVRELYEETGIKVRPKDLRPEGVFETVNDERHRYRYHFFVLELADKPAIRPQISELRDIRWMSRQELLADRHCGSVVRERVLAWFEP